RWPTMFSVTNTGLNTFPLCTLNVSPTKSGVIIERRDQVLIGDLDFVSFAFRILSRRWKSTNGPFLIERPIDQIQLSFIGRPFLRTRINRFEYFLCGRVL